MKITQTEITIYNNEIKPLLVKILEIRNTLQFIKVYPDKELSYSNELKIKTMEGLYREFGLLMINYGMTRSDLIQLSNHVERLERDKK